MSTSPPALIDAYGKMSDGSTPEPGTKVLFCCIRCRKYLEASTRIDSSWFAWCEPCYTEVMAATKALLTDSQKPR
jgi:hypothetical protein